MGIWGLMPRGAWQGGEEAAWREGGREGCSSPGRLGTSSHLPSRAQTPGSSLAKLVRDWGTLTVGSPEPCKSPRDWYEAAAPQFWLTPWCYWGRGRLGWVAAHVDAWPRQRFLPRAAECSPLPLQEQHGWKRNNHKLLRPHRPRPGSWGLLVGQDTPEHAGTVLQECTPRTEHGTELFWWCWGNGSVARRRRRGRLACSTALPAFRSSSLPTRPTQTHIGFSPSASCDLSRNP